MIRSIAFLALMALPAPAVLTAQETSEFTAAGIPVVFTPIEANEVVAVRLYLEGGSANLNPATAGIENFIATSAPRGTEKYTRDELAARMAATGTEISVEAFYDFTVLSVRAVSEHWDEAWDLFSQVVLHPTFPEPEVELVRGQIVNQLKGRIDNPDAYLAVLANNLLYAGHPYAFDPVGTIETIEAITIEQMKEWHRSRLTKENLTFVVVGNVGRDDLEDKIEDAFDDLPVTGGTARTMPPLERPAPAVEVTERQLPTNYIRGIFVAPDPGHPDYAALRVALDILDDRFFEEVRTKRNLSYAVSAGLSQRRANYGLLYVTAVDPATTIRVMLDEVERLKTEPISGQRLAQNVNVFVTRHWLGQETNMGRAATLGTFEMTGGGWEQADAFVRRVREVTPEDIQRVARTYLRSIHFAVLGDPAAIDRDLFTSL